MLSFSNGVGRGEQRARLESLRASYAPPDQDYFIWASNDAHIGISFGVVRKLKDQLAPLPAGWVSGPELPP